MNRDYEEKHTEDPELRELLKRSLRRAERDELQRDLWPQMLAKLSAMPERTPWHLGVPWFDWALAALAGAALLVFPGILPALFYHF